MLLLAPMSMGATVLSHFEIAVADPDLLIKRQWKITVRGITLRRKKRGSTQLETHLPSDLWRVFLIRVVHEVGGVVSSICCCWRVNSVHLLKNDRTIWWQSIRCMTDALASSDIHGCNCLVAFRNCSGGSRSVDKTTRKITVRGITLRRKKRGSTQLEMHLPSDQFRVFPIDCWWDCHYWYSGEFCSCSEFVSHRQNIMWRQKVKNLLKWRAPASCTRWELWCHSILAGENHAITSLSNKCRTASISKII
jgi:hypothetical protein